MTIKRISKDEIVVTGDDFGFLVKMYVDQILRHNPYVMEGPHGVDAQLRRWWPLVEDYYKRQIQCSIEVAIALDNSDDRHLQNKLFWIKFVQDHRPPKAAFTIAYHCHKCKASGLKLWRKPHAAANDDGHELLCAKCLAPDIEVDAQGLWGGTDQISGWLSAIPVDDTFWGYTSVPSQDIEWWQQLPTYKR